MGIGTTAAQKWDVSVLVLSPGGQCDWGDLAGVGATAAHPSTGGCGKVTQVKHHRRHSSGEVSQAASLQRRWCFRSRRLGKWVVAFTTCTSTPLRFLPTVRSLPLHLYNQQRAGKQLDAIASQIRLLGAPSRAADGPLSPDRARERTTHLAELRKSYVHQRIPIVLHNVL